MVEIDDAYRGDQRTGGNTALTGIEPAVSQLSNGNVVASYSGNEAYFAIRDGITGNTIVPSTRSLETFAPRLGVDVAGLTGGGFVMAANNFYGGSEGDIRVYFRTDAGAGVTISTST